jgi:hypothetical protein
VNSTAPTGHAAIRPAWTCGACGEDWPCPTARDRLTEEYGTERVSLATQMAVQLGRAATELKDATPHDLYLRFVEWTR